MKYAKNGSSHDGSAKDGQPPSVQLDVIQYTHRRGSGLGDGGGSANFYEPRREQTPASSGSGSRHVDGSNDKHRPEKRLTLFALHLAVIEKAASQLSALAFVWATVVLLGGFASDLYIVDFWSITVILVGEGARIYSRSHELEWQHHATWTSSAGAAHRSLRALQSSSRSLVRAIRTMFNWVGAIQLDHARDRDISAEEVEKAKEFQKKMIGYVKRRVWHAPDVPLLPYTGWVFVSKNISMALNWLQVLFALSSVALATMRLWKHNYGASDNRRPALILFYSLALAEALLFLLEKAYWTWKMSWCDLIDQVSKDCELGPKGHVSLRRFFYDAYSKCVDGSIFDGIKMDLVTFAEELLQSDFLEEQRLGVGILRQFGKSKSFASETLRKVGTNGRTIERLIEMLNWKNVEEAEVRECAAEVVSKLAGKQQNALRLAGIPGSIDSIMSLLHTGRDVPTDVRPHEAEDASSASSRHDFLQLNLLGLLIFKKLAKDHDNCGKIGNTRGLLPKIIEFTSAPPTLLHNEFAPYSQIKAVKRALQLLKMLVSATGITGKLLRQEIADIVFTVSNLREILHHGQQHNVLQKLAIDILTGLATDETAKERIANTGGIIKLLLSIFSNGEFACANSLCSEAGEPLAMLTLEDKKNCDLILKRNDVLDRLIPALDDKSRRLNASRILRNLCAYSGPESSDRLHGVTAAMPAVLKATMKEKDKLLEVSIGLTTQICKFMGPEQFEKELAKAGIKNAEYVEMLVNILNEHKHPNTTVPRIRRFVIQQAIWMMRSQSCYVELFRKCEMERLLESVADTTSDLECFHVFSGSVGLSRHRKTVSAIVESALALLAGAADIQEE